MKGEKTGRLDREQRIRRSFCINRGRTSHHAREEGTQAGKQNCRGKKLGAKNLSDKK